mgnify:CR=1 FL=1
MGEMRGHTKTVNAVAVRRDRPFRIATASEDQSICFYHGVPYKLNKQMDEVYMYITSYVTVAFHIVSKICLFLDTKVRAY